MGTFIRDLLTCQVKPLVQVCIDKLSWRKTHVIRMLTLINAIRKVRHPVLHMIYGLLKVSELVRNWRCPDVLYGTGFHYAQQSGDCKFLLNSANYCHMNKRLCQHSEQRSRAVDKRSVSLTIGLLWWPSHTYRRRHCWDHQSPTLKPVLWGYGGSAQASKRTCRSSKGVWVE